MESKVQIIECKKSFWNKVKEKISKIFFRKRSYIEENSEIIKENINIEKAEDNSKKEFMQVYEQIKNQEISLDEVDDNMLYKVMLLLKEEIDITNKKIDLEINEVAISLNNLNINNNKLQS